MLKICRPRHAVEHIEQEIGIDLDLPAFPVLLNHLFFKDILLYRQLRLASPCQFLGNALRKIPAQLLMNANSLHAFRRQQGTRGGHGLRFQSALSGQRGHVQHIFAVLLLLRIGSAADKVHGRWPRVPERNRADPQAIGARLRSPGVRRVVFLRQAERTAAALSGPADGSAKFRHR